MTHSPGVVTGGPGRLLVDRGEGGIVGLGDEAQPVAARSGGRPGGGASPGEERAVRREGSGGHSRGRGSVGRRPEVVEERAELLVGDGAAAAEVRTEELVLDRAVAEAEGVHHPASGEVVEHDHLLGQPHGVVEREQRGGDHDRRPAGHRRDGGGHRQGSGQVAVLRGVVLRHRDRLAAVLVGPRRHLERGLVEPGHLLGRLPGCSHVEPQPEHAAPSWALDELAQQPTGITVRRR